MDPIYYDSDPKYLYTVCPKVRERGQLVKPEMHFFVDDFDFWIPPLNDDKMHVLKEKENLNSSPIYFTS